MREKGFEVNKFRAWRVLGRSFSVLFRNLAPVGLLALAMLSVPYVVSRFLDFHYFGGLFVDFELDSVSWRGTLGLTLQLFATTCLTAVLAFGVCETLEDDRPGARALIRGGLARFPAALAVVVVMTVLQALPFAVQTLSREMPWTEGIGYLAFLLFMFPSLFLFVAIPAAALEGLALMRAIGRSFKLVASRFFRVIGLLFLVSVIMLVPVGIARLVLEVAAFDPAATPYHLLVWPDLLLTAFTAAFPAVTATVTFHALRLERDGPDVARVAAVFD